MNSQEGEKVQLCKPIKARNQVEGWLLQVQQVMEDTVLKMMRAGLNEFTSAEKNIDRKVWVTKHPGQVIATISQVLWCASSESYINEMVENPFAL